MRSSMRGGDFWSGLALAALGAYVVVQARGWEYMTEEGPGPGFFPMWYGSAMVVLSLALVGSSVVKRAATAKEFAWKDLGRGLACWAAFVGAIALMPLVGFPAAFALLTWFIVAIMCGRPHATGIVAGIAGSAAFYGLFEVALSVSLPHGRFF